MSSSTPAAMPATPNKPVKEEQNPSPPQAATASPLLVTLPFSPAVPATPAGRSSHALPPITLDNYYQRSSLTVPFSPNRIVYVSLHHSHPAFLPPAHGRSFLDRLPAEIMVNITSRLSVISRCRLRLASRFFEPYTRTEDADLDRKLDFYHSVEMAQRRDHLAATLAADPDGNGDGNGNGNERHMCYRCFRLLPADDFSKSALGRPPRNGGPRRRREREDCRRQFCRACGKKAQREGSRRAAAGRKVSNAAARAEKRRVEDLASLIGDPPGKECVVLPSSPAAAAGGAGAGAGAGANGNNNDNSDRKARNRLYYQREDLGLGTYGGDFSVNYSKVDW